MRTQPNMSTKAHKSTLAYSRVQTDMCAQRSGKLWTGSGFTKSLRIWAIRMGTWRTELKHKFRIRRISGSIAGGGEEQGFMGKTGRSSMAAHEISKSRRPVVSQGPRFTLTVNTEGPIGSPIHVSDIILFAFFDSCNSNYTGNWTANRRASIINITNVRNHILGLVL